MKTSDFNFHLPDELLAEHPSEHRDEAKLMVLNRATQTIEHKKFKEDSSRKYPNNPIKMRKSTFKGLYYTLFPYKIQI